MKRSLLFILKAGVSVGLLALLYHRVDPAALQAQFRQARPAWLALFYLLLSSNTLISSMKWRRLLAADGIAQPLGRLFASHLTGSFFNLFLPSTIGGDAYRIADIGRHTARTAHTAASILADRLTGFLALALYGLVFPFVARDAIPHWDGRFLLLPAVALGALAVLLAALVEQAWLRRIAARLPLRVRKPAMAVLDKILASMRAYTRQPAVWIQCLLLSFVFQFFAILAAYSLGRAIRLDVPLLPFCFFVPFISLMEMIPISVFGIGLRDTGYVWFMLAVGRSRADAAALSVLYVAATLLYVSIGGLLFVCRRQARPSAPPARE
jgi:uncharacterized protein (TIRG00374 family)